MNSVKIAAYAATSAIVLVLLWFVLIQPVFFPKFKLIPEIDDLFYTENTTYCLNIPVPDIEIRRITIDGEEKFLGSSSQDLEKGSQVRFCFEELKSGSSSHSVRFFGKLWKENYETKLLIVSYPMKYWKNLDNLEMVKVPGGCYKMGCGKWAGKCEQNDKPVKKVCLPPFEIGKYEVTQEQWEIIMGYNPSEFKNGKQFPVENVSWNDIQEFIRRLNILTGKNYCLPTEAQWEYAARSRGKPEKYAGFSEDGKLDQYANFCDKNCLYSWAKSGNYDDGFANTSPVGNYKPNGLGIYDMTGNVWEWCQDLYYGNHEGPFDGIHRVTRGGGWFNSVEGCRAVFRTSSKPGHRNFAKGFRLVFKTP